MVDLKMLDKLARVCRKHGIAHLKSEGFEIELELKQTKAKAKKPDVAQLVEVKLPEQYRALSDDELLFGSAQ